MRWLYPALIVAAVIALAYPIGERIYWVNIGPPIEQSLNGDYVPEFACPGEWIDIKAVEGDPAMAEYRCGWLVRSKGGYVLRLVLADRTRRLKGDTAPVAADLSPKAAN